MKPIQGAEFTDGMTDFRPIAPEAVEEQKNPPKTAFEIEMENRERAALADALAEAEAEADQFFGRKASDEPQTAFEVEARRGAADAANPPVSAVPESAPPLSSPEGEQTSLLDPQEDPATAAKENQLPLAPPPLPSNNS